VPLLDIVMCLSFPHFHKNSRKLPSAKVHALFQYNSREVIHNLEQYYKFKILVNHKQLMGLLRQI